jgi:signal peptidase I
MKRPVVAVGVAIALYAAFYGLRSVVFDWYHSSSASMMPTVEQGARFIPVLKCAYVLRVPFSSLILVRTAKPERGDVVLLRNPEGSHKPFIKRVIGLPGDTVELRNERLFLNGVEQPLRAETGPKRQDGEEILIGHAQVGSVKYRVMILPNRRALRTFGPITVPMGEVFVLGDSRDESRDSRFFGTRSVDELWGRVLVKDGAA